MDHLSHYLSLDALLREQDSVSDLLLQDDFTLSSNDFLPGTVVPSDQDLDRHVLAGTSIDAVCQRKTASNDGEQSSKDVSRRLSASSSSEDEPECEFSYWKARTIYGAVDGASDSVQPVTNADAERNYDKALKGALAELNGLEHEDELPDYRGWTPSLTSSSPEDEITIATPVYEDPCPYLFHRLGDETGSDSGSGSDEEYVPRKCPPKPTKRPNKRKRLTFPDDVTNEPGSRVAQVSAPQRNGSEQQTPVPPIPNKVFNVNFLMEKFEIKSVYAPGKVWSCPDELHTGDSCAKSFSVDALWDHVAMHVTELRRARRNGTLLCPLTGECTWQDDSRPAEKIDPNDSLVRHIMDSHLEARKARCPCGSEIGRPHRDQVIRHLEASRHEQKLEKRRKEGIWVPEYPNIRSHTDRVMLLQEQQRWLENAAAQEQPVKWRKRARHE